MFRFTQTRFYCLSIILGLTLYQALFAGITGGVVWLAGVGGFLLTFMAFAVFAWGFEANPRTGKVRPLYHRGQSYLFMAGPFVTPAMFMLAAQAWHNYWGLTPAWLRSRWWFVVGLGVIVVFGLLFRRVDHERYTQQAAKLMLKSPSKWWLDYWQMPVSVAIVVVAVLPTWCMPGPVKWLTGMLIVLCVVLGVVDGARKLDPFTQHVQWNAARFSRLCRD